ncbi:hypothetical protein ABPG74_001217 [Tetrahymena malaccensis]
MCFATHKEKKMQTQKYSINNIIIIKIIINYINYIIDIYQIINKLKLNNQNKLAKPQDRHALLLGGIRGGKGERIFIQDTQTYKLAFLLEKASNLQTYILQQRVQHSIQVGLQVGMFLINGNQKKSIQTKRSSKSLQKYQ